MGVIEVPDMRHGIPVKFHLCLRPRQLIIDITRWILGLEAVQVQAVVVLGSHDPVPDDQLISRVLGRGVLQDEVDEEQLGIPVEEGVKVYQTIRID